MDPDHGLICVGFSDEDTKKIAAGMIDALKMRRRSDERERPPREGSFTKEQIERRFFAEAERNAEWAKQDGLDSVPVPAVHEIIKDGAVVSRWVDPPPSIKDSITTIDAITDMLKRAT